MDYSIGLYHIKGWCINTKQYIKMTKSTFLPVLYLFISHSPLFHIRTDSRDHSSDTIDLHARVRLRIRRRLVRVLSSPVGPGRLESHYTQDTRIPVNQYLGSHY